MDRPFRAMVNRSPKEAAPSSSGGPHTKASSYAKKSFTLESIYLFPFSFHFLFSKLDRLRE